MAWISEEEKGKEAVTRLFLSPPLPLLLGEISAPLPGEEKEGEEKKAAKSVRSQVSCLPTNSNDGNGDSGV